MKYLEFLTSALANTKRELPIKRGDWILYIGPDPIAEAIYRSNQKIRDVIEVIYGVGIYHKMKQTFGRINNKPLARFT